MRIGAWGGLISLVAAVGLLGHLATRGTRHESAHERTEMHGVPLEDADDVVAPSGRGGRPVLKSRDPSRSMASDGVHRKGDSPTLCSREYRGLDALFGPDDELAEEAAQELAVHPARQTRELELALVKFLQMTTPPRRALILQLLGRWLKPSQGNLSALSAHLQDPDEEARLCAAGGLASHGRMSNSVAVVLQDLMRSRSQGIQTGVLQFVEGMADYPHLVIDVLRRGVNADSRTTVIEAMEAASALGARAIPLTADLVSLARSSGEQAVRQGAIRTLAAIHHADAAPLVSRSLTSQHSGERVACLRALQRFTGLDEAALLDVESCLAAESLQVRAAAASVLTGRRKGSTRAWDAVLVALRSNDNEARAIATTCLAGDEAPPQWVVDGFAESLASEDSRTGAEVAAALSDLPEHAFSLLDLGGRFASSGERARIAVVHLVGMRLSATSNWFPEAGAVLASALRDDSSDVRIAAVRVVASRKHVAGQVRDGVFLNARHPDSDVRWETLWALNRLSPHDEKARALLQVARNDPDSRVRQDAIELTRGIE